MNKYTSLFNYLSSLSCLTFTPKPNLDKNDKLTVKEGDVVGPIFCSADCNPPCNVTWRYKDSNRLRDALSQNGILLLQSVNRNVTQIICSSRWKNESMEKDILLDVQCLYICIIYNLNFEIIIIGLTIYWFYSINCIACRC